MSWSHHKKECVAVWVSTSSHVVCVSIHIPPPELRQWKSSCLSKCGWYYTLVCSTSTRKISVKNINTDGGQLSLLMCGASLFSRLLLDRQMDEYCVPSLRWSPGWSSSTTFCNLWFIFYWGLLLLLLLFLLLLFLFFFLKLVFNIASLSTLLESLSATRNSMIASSSCLTFSQPLLKTYNSLPFI